MTEIAITCYVVGHILAIAVMSAVIVGFNKWMRKNKKETKNANLYNVWKKY